MCCVDLVGDDDDVFFLLKKSECFNKKKRTCQE